MDGTEKPQEAPAVVVESTAPVDAPASPIAEPAAPEPAIAPIDIPADAPVETPAVEPVAESVLGDAATPEKKDGDVTKPEIKADGDKPVDDVKPVDAPAEVVLPVYEEFKLPENYTADKESIGEFTKLLGELEIASGKMDHAGYQEAGQKLIDLGAKNVQDSIERLNQYYSQYHENQKKEWFESFKKDPEMGGEKLNETVSALRGAVENYGGTPEQIAEFRQVMKDTGVGNHPAVTRVLYNMVQKINKYETEADNGNGGSNRIVPGARPAPNKVKDYQRFYGNNS